jgi:acyl-coenzyme A thioesterase PaaI-like protein
MDLDVGRAERAVSLFFGVSQHEIGDWQNGEILIEGIAPVREHLCGSRPGIRAGALLALIDHVGGLTAGLAALPDGWVVSTNLSMRTATLSHRGPLRLRAEVLRRGRAAVVVRVRVTDDGAAGALVADGVLTSAVLVPEGGPPRWERPMSMAPPAYAEAPPLGEWLGVQAVDGTTLEIELRDELRNPWGILHGAVVASLVDLAAVHAVGDGEGAASTDAVLHFLSPGRVGPVYAHAEVCGRRADGDVVRVELHDRGANDRLMAVAVVTVAAADDR